MSDGSLSQEEINALLSGDSAQPASTNAGSQGLDDAGKSVIQELLGDVAIEFGVKITGVLSKNVSCSAPELQYVDKAQLLALLPDEAVAYSSGFKGGLEGAHLHIFTKEDALKLAGLMIGQDDLDIDATTINAVGEALSQCNDALSEVVGNKIGETVLLEDIDGQSTNKSDLSLSGEHFLRAAYNLTVEDDGSFSVYEIFESRMLEGIVGKLGKTENQQASEMDDLSALLGGDLLGGASQDISAGAGGASGVGTSGISGAGGQQGPSVHGVDLPNFSPFNAPNAPADQRNIGLLMDVSMELTVELGRTKWKIKDILSLGEGTIIELDKLAGEPVDILVNNNLLAKGEVVVIDENFGVRVTEIVTTIDRMAER